MDAKTKPIWLQRREAKAPVYAEWWRRRHHCSDVVLGQRHREAVPDTRPMQDIRCRNCSLPITAAQEVILAKVAYPTRVDECDVKPLDVDRPEVFHAGCLPGGWLLLPGGPMPLAAALSRLS